MLANETEDEGVFVDETEDKDELVDEAEDKENSEGTLSTEDEDEDEDEDGLEGELLGLGDSALATRNSSDPKISGSPPPLKYMRVSTACDNLPTNVSAGARSD